MERLRRRWTLRLRQPDGTEAWTVVEVRRGVIHIQRSVQAVTLTPADMRRLLEIFREAQTVALYDRGDW